MQSSLLTKGLFLGIIILFITLIFLYYAAVFGVSDNVVGGDHNYAYDSSQYSDNDGYSYNSNENKTNHFSYNQTKWDDIDRDEFENSPLTSFKFLINNGFYLKKNDKLYPLLRLDLKSIAKNFAKVELNLQKLGYKKTARSPVVIKQKWFLDILTIYPEDN